MDNNDLKERDFEAYIEHWLTTEGGYTKGNQATYDKERAIDLKTLIRFLQLTQEKKWVLYEKKYGAQTETRLYNVLQDKIHERNLINDDNSRIIICTLHRFPLIYNEIKEHAGKRYALIVDEAHSSQTGKSAEEMKAALADTEEALKEMAAMQDIAEEELEKQRDAIMDTLLAQSQHNNLSFYAFTATPKPKTLRTFGICTHQDIDPTKCRYEAFHTYSMQQAIEEGFIKDVLLSYTPYEGSISRTEQWGEIWNASWCSL